MISTVRNLLSRQNRSRINVAEHIVVVYPGPVVIEQWADLIDLVDAR